jgi:hypothetical protein
MPLGSGRKHLHDEDRVFDQLFPLLIRSASHSHVCDITGIAAIGTGDPCRGLRAARSPRAQGGVDRAGEPST